MMAPPTLALLPLKVLLLTVSVPLSFLMAPPPPPAEFPLKVLFVMLYVDR